MRVPREEVRAVATDILAEFGAPPETVDEVATALVRADARGYGTHGIGLLPLYAEMVEDGAIDPGAEPSVENSDGATIEVDGRGGFGQLAARDVAAHGIATADSHGAAAVGLRGATHLGRTGDVAERVAREGMVVLGFTNAGGGAKNVAPHGGHGRKLVPNTIALGIPTFDVYPFDVVVDFATSQVSGSVVRRAHRTGGSLDDEWTTTESGDPVRDPAAFMAGEGALLPLGGRTTGHKGYGLSVAAELLAGIVGGEAVVGERDPTWFSNGGAFLVVDPTRFVTRPEIEARIRAFGDHVRSDEVRLPGEGAYDRLVTSRTEGLEMAPTDLVPVAELAVSLNVALPETVRRAVESVEREVGDGSQTW